MEQELSEKKYDLEIIIPCYNEEDFLSEAVNSIIRAREKSSLKIAILISDNCSKDKSLLIAQKFASSFTDVRIISHKVNIGARSNWLNALKSINARYFMFIGAHDFISQDYFSELENVLPKKNGEYLVFMPNEFKVIEGSVEPPERSLIHYKFHKNPRIRFWQVVFDMHNSTEIHSVFPYDASDFVKLLNCKSVSWDHVFMHSYFTKYDSAYLSAPFYRRYKTTVGPHNAYVNSFGEVQNREERVIGDLEIEANNAFLPAEILANAEWAVPKKFYWLAELLLGGKYKSSIFSYFFYRSVKYFSQILFFPRGIKNYKVNNLATKFINTSTP